jgi:circadian clock protein KaiC
MGGGFRQAASILIAGSSGTGKTTMACSFALAACSRGERVLYISFEESEAAIVDTMLSPGVDLRPALAAGQLEILTALPESMGVEEHLLRILHKIEQFHPDHLVLEALSACQRMGPDQVAFNFAVRLIDNCKTLGMTSLFTNQIRPGISGFSPDMEQVTGLGISSLMDTLVLLEQRWAPADYKRQLLIIKSRGSNHSHGYHPFTISDQGINIISPLTGEISEMTEETSQ